jgi:hypothetical protein
MTGSAERTAPVKTTLAQMTAEHFIPYRGSVLTFLRPHEQRKDDQGKREPVELELLRVTSYSDAARGLRTPFSLIFRSVGGQTLGRGLHTLEHDAFEPSDIFLSRILVPGEYLREGGVFYEAVFG